MAVVQINEEDTQPKIRTMEDDLNDKILSLEKYVKLRLEIIEENMITYNKLNLCIHTLTLILAMMLGVNVFFGINIMTNILTIILLVPMVIFYYKMKVIKKESSEKLSKLKTEYEEFLKEHTY